MEFQVKREPSLPYFLSLTLGSVWFGFYFQAIVRIYALCVPFVNEKLRGC